MIRRNFFKSVVAGALSLVGLARSEAVVTTLPVCRRAAVWAVGFSHWWLQLTTEAQEGHVILHARVHWKGNLLLDEPVSLAGADDWKEGGAIALKQYLTKRLLSREEMYWLYKLGASIAENLVLGYMPTEKWQLAVISIDGPPPYRWAHGTPTAVDDFVDDDCALSKWVAAVVLNLPRGQDLLDWARTQEALNNRPCVPGATATWRSPK